MQNNPICNLLKIKYPIIQGGMIWNSGYKLASAVSNSGGLGLIGAGSMDIDTLRYHIQQCTLQTDKPFGINLPLIYKQVESMLEVIIEEKVPVVFTSAGNPKIFTPYLQQHGLKVAHVVSNTKFAQKAEEAGVDAVVAEGFEAGGHNGYDELTSLTLIPAVRQAVSIPLLAAGGIATGAAMFAVMALGADGVQIGSRFAATNESSAHENFKQFVIDAKEGDTMLMLKEIIPVRLLKNKFFNELIELYAKKADTETLKAHLGKGRAKKGMFLGDIDDGELEIGQVSALIKNILPVKEVIAEIISDFHKSQVKMNNLEL